MAHAKITLTERLSQDGREAPKYSTTASGPRHEQLFTAVVSSGDEELGTGSGKSKREAERLAAEDALRQMDRNDDPDTGSDSGSAGDFDGPWPIFQRVLERSLQVAERRVPQHLTGDEARDAIAGFTISLYKDLLGSLGEVEEYEEDDDEEEDD